MVKIAHPIQHIGGGLNTCLNIFFGLEIYETTNIMYFQVHHCGDGPCPGAPLTASPARVVTAHTATGRSTVTYHWECCFLPAGDVTCHSVKYKSDEIDAIR